MQKACRATVTVCQQILLMSAEVYTRNIVCVVFFNTSITVLVRGLQPFYF